jgi:nucleoside-diphosphate-sugar epimerase
MSGKRIGITGASGFIGRHLVAYFAARGDEVVAFRRRPVASSSRVKVRPFALPDAFDPADLIGLDAVVHAALVEYGPAAPDADAINLAGVRAVRDAARAHGAHLVMLSTLSAHPRALSHYGRAKLAAEAELDPARDAILRLGLVLGHGGLFGSMVDVLREARFVPLPDGGRQPIQTLWMGDLCEALGRVVDTRLAGRFDVAAPEVHTMRGLYESALRGMGLRRALIDVPLPLVELGVSVLEALRVPFAIRRENVLGLKRLMAFDTAPSMRALGVESPVGLDEAVRRLLAVH